MYKTNKKEKHAWLEPRVFKFTVAHDVLTILLTIKLPQYIKIFLSFVLLLFFLMRDIFRNQYIQRAPQGVA